MSGKKSNQIFLRKAMSDHKKKSVKKIDSPLAKYTDGGQLMCVICKTIVKSEIVWPIHLNSKSHKETLVQTKKEIEEKEKKVSFKRPGSPSANIAVKKVKGILKNPGHNKPPSSTILPSDFFDNPGPSVVSIITNGKSKTEINSQDNNKQSGDNEQVKEAESNALAALPEGFFDDPIQDAKVRNIEYKDPIEEEWERYQKEIKEETAQSAQIIADDQEEATAERQIDEVEEQIRHFSRVVDIAKRKDKEFQQRQKNYDNIDEDLSSDDDSDYDEFLDWRVKSSNNKMSVNK